MRGALYISVIKMENVVVSHPGSVLSPITFYLHGNRHPFECTPLLFIHCIWLLTIVQRVWGSPSPLWVFTWQHFLGNSASTKGKLLIRHETIASTAAITISDGTKHWLLLFPLPFILIRNLPSIIPSTQPIHFPPPTSPLQSSMISPLLRREQEREREKGRRRAEGEIGEKKKRDPKGPGRLSFPLLGYAALPRFHGSGKLCLFPLRGPSSPQSKAL